MNTSGGRISEALTRHSGYRVMYTDYLPDELEDFDEVVANGEWFRDALAQVVHGEVDAERFPVDDMRAWLRFSYKTDALMSDTLARAKRLGAS